MEKEKTMMPAGTPEFVKEAEMEADESAKTESKQEITIKFGKGLMGVPFTAKNGNELVKIRIPNADPSDKRPWESFVISPKMVHENQFGKGLWMKLPADGYAKLSRNVSLGKDQQGKQIWKAQTRVVSNRELKTLLESYKTRDSVRGKLSEKKDDVSVGSQNMAKTQTKKNENSL